MPVQKHKSDETELSPKVPLSGNTLHQTLRLFEEHHLACQNRRQLGRVHEIVVEEHRRSVLSKKYQENLRQVNGGRPEPARPQLNSTSDCVENMESAQSPQSSDTVQATPTEEPPSLLEASLPGKNNRRPTASNCVANSAVTDSSSTIKLEPDSPEQRHCASSPMASKSSPAPSNSSKGSSSPANGKTPPCLSDVPDPKRRKLQARRSNDALRPPPPRKSSFGNSDDCSDDLKLSAEDCRSITNSTARLIKPLEESETIMSSSSPAGGIPAVTRQGVVSLQVGGTGIIGQQLQQQQQQQQQLEDTSSLQQELDEFSKVMAQVTKEETAREKERQSAVQFNLSAGGYNGAPPHIPPHVLGNGTLSTSSSSFIPTTSPYPQPSRNIYYPSNGQQKFTTTGSSGGTQRQSSGDLAYQYRAGLPQQQVQQQSPQVESLYLQTVTPLQGSSHLKPLPGRGILPYATDHLHGSLATSLGNGHYCSSSSSSSSSSSPLGSSLEHPALYGQLSYGYALNVHTGQSHQQQAMMAVGNAGEWSQVPAQGVQDSMLARGNLHDGTLPTEISYLPAKLHSTAGMQPLHSQQYQYTPSNNQQSFPHTISYGRFTNPM